MDENPVTFGFGIGLSGGGVEFGATGGLPCPAQGRGGSADHNAGDKYVDGGVCGAEKAGGGEGPGVVCEGVGFGG